MTLDTIMARFADPVTLPEPWQPTTDRTNWSADRARLDETGTLAAASPPRWPQLAPIGMDDKGQWRPLNLEALGVVSITGDPVYGADLARTWWPSWLVVPWARDLQLDRVGYVPSLPRSTQHASGTTTPAP